MSEEFTKIIEEVAGAATPIAAYMTISEEWIGDSRLAAYGYDETVRQCAMLQKVVEQANERFSEISLTRNQARILNRFMTRLMKLDECMIHRATTFEFTHKTFPGTEQGTSRYLH